MYDTQNIQSALSRIENKKVRENFDRSGFYRATVVSNNDPMNLGRVKIRIPSLHGISSEQTGYVEDNLLPYAFPGSIPGAGFNEGQYLLPSPGHTVWVSFETGTENFIYFGSLYSKAPEYDKYIYKGRTINNGNIILVAGDDIPSDYDPNKHVVYRTYFGDIIYMDDRSIDGSIVLENRSGNKIKFGDKTISIITANPLNAYLPYMDIYYCSDDNYQGLISDVSTSSIFKDTELSENVETFSKGNMVLFIHSNKIKNTGIIDSVESNIVRIKTIM